MPATSFPALQETGERLHAGAVGNVAIEHLHRYALAVDMAVDRDVLDVACGTGYGAKLMAGVAKTVTGVDVSEETVAFAARFAAAPNAKYVCVDCCELPFADNSFSLVVSFETIEHVTDQVKFVQEVRRVLRPEGVSIWSTPNVEATPDRSGSGNPFHVHELTPSEFQALLRSEFDDVRISHQRVVHGSVVIPASGEIQAASLHLGGFDCVGRLAHSPRGDYLIAIAANHVAADFAGSSVFLSPGVPSDAELGRLNEQRILKSWTWRLTVPFRWIASMCRTERRQ